MRTEPPSPRPQAALLTGGGDRPYALGLASSLIERRIRFDFIGSDFLEAPELRQSPYVRFLNLRGDMDPGAPLLRKLARLAAYYARLIRYAATTEAPVFHILWNNKIEFFDRTLLLYFYRLLKKRLVFTVHNVNAAKRDGKDSVINRHTLKTQYRLVDHLFVHTEKMKCELCAEFGVPPVKVTVIPFGLNNSVPNTELSRNAARQLLGFNDVHKLILFFGNIAPYKGLEYLVEAMAAIRQALPESRLIIVGRPKGARAYWERIERRIEDTGLEDAVYKRIEYVSDEDIEVYFKAADVLVLPYTSICQSGVLFLGYRFGTPVIATNVGSLHEHIVPGESGAICKPSDVADLQRTTEEFFASDMYRNRQATQQKIRCLADQNSSWAEVGRQTKQIYEELHGSSD